MDETSFRQVITVWKWEVKDARRRSGWRLLTWRMTEEDAAAWAVKNGEVRRVEGSSEERAVVQAAGPDRYGENSPLPPWILRGKG